MPKVVITRYYGKAADRIRAQLKMDAKPNFTVVETHELDGELVLAVTCAEDAPKYSPSSKYAVEYRTVK